MAPGLDPGCDITYKIRLIQRSLHILAYVQLAHSRPGCRSKLRKCYSHLSGGSFLAEKASWALSGCLPIESADYYMLVNELAWLMSQVCLLRLEVELASVLESELEQKWRYGALKACIG